MTYGITLINRLQLWSQPLWLILLLLPYAFVIAKNPGALADWTTFAGREGEAGAFNCCPSAPPVPWPSPW